VPRGLGAPAQGTGPLAVYICVLAPWTRAPGPPGASAQGARVLAPPPRAPGSKCNFFYIWVLAPWAGAPGPLTPLPRAPGPLAPPSWALGDYFYKFFFACCKK